MLNFFSTTKRILLLFVCLALPLSGCGKKNADDAASSAQSQADADASQTAADILLTPEDATQPSAQQTSAPLEEGTVFSLSEAIEYIRVLPPAELELDGESMRDYFIYPEDGIVLVDGRSCVKIGVYELVPETQTNRVLGIYLLARDRSHLYRLDPETGQVRQLEASGLTVLDTVSDEIEPDTADRKE